MKLDNHSPLDFLAEDAAFGWLMSQLPEDLQAQADDLYQDGVLVREIPRLLGFTLPPEPAVTSLAAFAVTSHGARFALSGEDRAAVED